MAHYCNVFTLQNYFQDISNHFEERHMQKFVFTVECSFVYNSPHFQPIWQLLLKKLILPNGMAQATVKESPE